MANSKPRGNGQFEQSIAVRFPVIIGAARGGGGLLASTDTFAWALGAAASGYLVLQAQQRAHCVGVAHRVAPPVIIEVHENIPLLRLPFP